MSDWIQEESPQTRQRHIDEIKADIKTTADNLYKEIAEQEEPEIHDEEPENHSIEEPYPSEPHIVSDEEPYEEDIHEEKRPEIHAAAPEDHSVEEPYPSEPSHIVSEEEPYEEEDIQEDKQPEILAAEQNAESFTEEIMDVPLSKPQEAPKSISPPKTVQSTPEKSKPKIVTAPEMEDIDPFVYKSPKEVRVLVESLGKMYNKVDVTLKESPTKANKLRLYSREEMLTSATSFNPGRSGENFAQSQKTTPQKNKDVETEKVKRSPAKDTEIVVSKEQKNSHKKELYNKEKLDRIMQNILAREKSPNANLNIENLRPPPRQVSESNQNNQNDESQKVYFTNNDSIKMESPTRFAPKQESSVQHHADELSEIGRDFLQLRLDTENPKNSKEMATPTPLKSGTSLAIKCACGRSLMYRESVGEDGHLRECLEAIEDEEDSVNRESLAQRRNFGEKTPRIEKKREECNEEVFSASGWKSKVAVDVGERKVKKPEEKLKVMRKTERVWM